MTFDRDLMEGWNACIRYSGLTLKAVEHVLEKQLFQPGPEWPLRDDEAFR